MMAYFFGGIRWGGYSVISVFCGVFIFSLLESKGIRFPQNPGLAAIH